MSFKSLYLPVGLCLALLTALTVPGLGSTLKGWGLIPWLVFGIFLVNGFQTRFSEGDVDRLWIRCFAILIFTSLFLSPVLAKSLQLIWPAPQQLFLGLAAISAMPTTLSSGIVITQVAGGHVVWATLFTIGLSFVAIFTIPLTLGFMLDDMGDINLNPWAMLTKLFALVLLPFVMGLGLKRLFSLKGLNSTLSYIPSTFVITIALMSASSKHPPELDTSIWVWMVAMSFGLHMLLFALHGALAFAMRLPRDRRLALTFIGAQKTLPLALAVLGTMGCDAPTAVLFCVVFHFIQLLTDSILAGFCRSSRPAVL